MSFQILRMGHTQRRQHLRRFPCLDDEPMDLEKPPPFRAKNLGVPRLRKCPFDLDTVDWRRARPLGMGTDGCVFRVYFGDEGPFALKLFWVPSLKAQPMEGYAAAHRECQVAALLQTIRASLDQAAAAAATVAAGGTPDGPVDPPYLLAKPVDHSDCLHNFFAFAEEMRREPVKMGHLAEPRELVPVTTMPRFAQCYGWLRFAPKTLRPRIPRRFFPSLYAASRKCIRRFDWDCADAAYYGIVYEYIAGAGGDPHEPLPLDWPKTIWQAGLVQFPPQPPRPPTPPSPSEKQHKQQRPPRAAAAARKRRLTKAERAAEEAAAAAEAQAAEAARATYAAWEAQVEKIQAEMLRLDTHVPAADRAQATAVLDFLHLAGFQMTNTALARNWKSGVLVDHSELVGPYMAGWQSGPDGPTHRIYERLGLREDAVPAKGVDEPGLAAEAA